MPANKEIPIDDAELDALMAELDAQTSGSVEVPVVAAPVPEPAPKVAEKAAPIPEPALIEVAALPVKEPEIVREPEPAPKVAETVAKPALVVVSKVAPAVEPEPTSESEAVIAEPDQQVIKRQPAPLQFHIDVAEFRTETAVSDTGLDKCMLEQNGLRAYYGEQAARSEAQASRIKVRFDVMEATLYDKHRKALALIGEKTTEKMIETAVKTDPIWARGKNTLIEAEIIAAINKSLVESLKDRRDMIIQLGADRRDEYKGQARVMAAQDARADMGNRAQAAAR